MRHLLLLTLGLLIIFPTVAQEKSDVRSEIYLQWKNKSKLGISINYDAREYDHEYSVLSKYGFLPTREDTPPQIALEVIPFISNYKIEGHMTSTIRLQADYWIFPFLNIYASGGKIYDYAKINAKVQVNKVNLPPFSKDIETDGWIYGGGAKSEFIYHNFKPQAEYSIFWNHLNYISSKSLFQTLSFKLGYVIPVNKLWIKNIDIYAGSLYNHVKFKNHYMIFYDEPTLRQIFDAVRQPDEKPVQILAGIADIITLKNIHDWNVTTGVEMELCHHLHYKLGFVFLGKEMTFSTGITYRLFGKK